MENIKSLLSRKKELSKDLEEKKKKFEELQKEIENTIDLESFDKIDKQLNETYEYIQKIEKYLENFKKNENTIVKQVRNQKDKEYNQENAIIEKNYTKLNKEYLKFLAVVEKIGIQTQKEIDDIERPLQEEYQLLRNEGKIGKFDFEKLEQNKVEYAEIYFRNAYNDLKFQD
ncbi:MAG: hypothetical protein ACRC4X_04145 [Cetobacterium sp.]